jgi:SAM-dependent methyltransferase
VSAVDRWASALAAWAIPERLLAAAPDSPFGFDVTTFDRAAERALSTDTPSRRVALDALPGGGTVLDVGCGGGSASLSLAPRLGHAIGLDEHAGMLAAFAARAQRLGVGHEEVLGRWPDIQATVGVADVVVCHHVLYNVADLAPFVQALTAHAGRRVVVEITTRHPLAWLSPLWQRLHDRRQPERPTLNDVTAALGELGIRASVRRWAQPAWWSVIDDDLVRFARRRLCLGPEDDERVREALAAADVPRIREVATLWWAGDGPGEVGDDPDPGSAVPAQA